MVIRSPLDESISFHSSILVTAGETQLNFLKQGTVQGPVKGRGQNMAHHHDGGYDYSLHSWREVRVKQKDLQSDWRKHHQRQWGAHSS